jgi:hypothetical protein
VSETAKKFVRRPWVQSTLAWLVSSYLAVTLKTIRWRIENREPADLAAAAPGGVITCFWHGGLALAPAARPVLAAKPRRVLISNSPDGELIAKIIARLGLHAIRGSSTQDNRANRRSVEAFREAVRFLDDGGVMLITPDGPRGPNQQMPHGPVMMARTRETPVFLVGLAAKPALTLKSWDRTRIPLPFGKGAVVFDGPVSVTRSATHDCVQAKQAEWQARLNAAQDRAEALVGAR